VNIQEGCHQDRIDGGRDQEHIRESLMPWPINGEKSFEGKSKHNNRAVLIIPSDGEEFSPSAIICRITIIRVA
jgi:hypothetical protein